MEVQETQVISTFLCFASVDDKFIDTGILPCLSVAGYPPYPPPLSSLSSLSFKNKQDI